MMTKEQHIDYWLNTAQYDWTGVDGAFNTKNYMHCLFWAHLMLEKLAKALLGKTPSGKYSAKSAQCIVAFRAVKYRFGGRDNEIFGRFQRISTIRALS